MVINHLLTGMILQVWIRECPVPPEKTWILWWRFIDVVPGLEGPTFGTNNSMWMFPKIVGFPSKSSILIGFFHYKPSILGYLYFWKHPWSVLRHSLMLSNAQLTSVLWAAPREDDETRWFEFVWDNDAIKYLAHLRWSPYSLNAP